MGKTKQKCAFFNRFRGIESLEQRRLLSVNDLTGHALPPEAYSPFDDSDWTVSPTSRSGGITEEEAFNLQSKPGSNFTIFLDFDGHVTEGTSWNASYGVPSIVSPPFDLDGDTNSYNQMELERIYISWARTAEDWAPFDVNVTTRDPGLDALMNSGGGDQTWGARAIATVDNFANCGCGGFAFLNTFDDSIDTPTFVFNLGEGSLGETFSHEVGHMVGLNHDGDFGQTYYPGHGVGATSWGPIMGAPFDENVTTWSDGDYFDANNGEDDLQIITAQNGFTYRVDDFGNTLGSATRLDVTGGTSVDAFGIIERNTDRDYFEFETGAGNVSLDILPLGTRPNLDVWAGIYDAGGNLVAESNPSNQLEAGFNLNLAAGVYRLRVEGVGSHDVYNPVTDNVDAPAVKPWQNSSPEGYSDYGSIGQYKITGSIVAPDPDLFSVVATDAIKSEGGAGSTTFEFTVSRVGNTGAAASVDWEVLDTLPELVGDNYPDLATASDFAGGTLFQGTANFAAGQTSQTITFDVIGDADVEYDEYFDVALSNPSTGWQMADSRATGIILSDESLVGFPTLGAFDSVNEGPFDGALLRWRQVAAASGSFDEWSIDNLSITNSSFSEDFDPDIDTSLWKDISNASAASQFVGTQGNSLVFTGGAERWAITNPLDLMPGETVEFDIIFGDNTNGGENADPGEDVFLEFSLDNGSNWNSIAVFDTEDYTSWTTVQATLPVGIDTNPAGQLDFKIGRTFGTAESVTVDWSVDVAGVTNPADAADFAGGVLPSGQVTFAAGETEATIQIDVSSDLDFEPDENFNVVIDSATGAGVVSVDPERNSGNGTIFNDDAAYVVDPGPQFRWRQLDNSGDDFDNWAIDNVSITNGSLNDDFDPDIDLGQWSAIEGGVVNSDFGGSGNSLYFTGSIDPRMAVTNPVLAQAGDMLSFDIIYGNDVNGGENPEGGEEVVLEYSLNGTSWTQIAEYPLNITSWTSIQVPVPPDAITPPRVANEGDAGPTTFEFDVLRSGVSGQSTSVSWEVNGIGVNPVDGNDFVGGVLPSGILNFAPNDAVLTVVIEVSGDTTFEPDEMFEFRVLSNSVNPAAVATIVNDDTAPNGDFNGDGLYDCVRCR